MTANSPTMIARRTFSETIRDLIEGSEKSQIEIARALGYENANIITMFKKGTSRVPPEKIVPLAFALETDPGALLLRWFEVYMPGVFPDIVRYLG